MTATVSVSTWNADSMGRNMITGSVDEDMEGLLRFSHWKETRSHFLEVAVRKLCPDGDIFDASPKPRVSQCENHLN